MRLHRLLIALLTVLSISLSFTYIPLAYADQDREKERLALMAKQVSALIEMAEAIERSEAENRYPKFQYAVLKEDLALIRQGINQYVKSVLNSTRDIYPLMGHYTIERAQ